MENDGFSGASVEINSQISPGDEFNQTTHAKNRPNAFVGKDLLLQP